MAGVAQRDLLVGIQLGLHLREDLLADDRRDRDRDPASSGRGAGFGPARPGASPIYGCGPETTWVRLDTAALHRPGCARCRARWPRSTAACPSGSALPDRSAAGPAAIRSPADSRYQSNSCATSTASAWLLPHRGSPAEAARDPPVAKRRPRSTAAVCPPAAWPAARGASAQRSACSRTRRPPRGSAVAADRADRSSSAGPGTPPDSRAWPAHRSAAPDVRSCGTAALPR